MERGEDRRSVRCATVEVGSRRRGSRDVVARVSGSRLATRTSYRKRSSDRSAYDRGVDRDGFRSWLERYFAAWVSNDPVDVAALFAEDAEYSYGPFREPERGRDRIVRAWIDGGVPRGLRTRHEVLAVEGDVGVARWQVTYMGDDGLVEMDGVLVCTFDPSGRCTIHREWFDRRGT